MAVAQRTTATAKPVPAPPPRRRIRWGSIIVNMVLALICIVWTIPTLGLLVSSIRPREEIRQSGWWEIFPHGEWVQVSEVKLELPTNGKPVPERIRDRLLQPVRIGGDDVRVTYEQLTAGFILPNGQQIRLTRPRDGLVSVQERQTVASTNFTIDNYESVLSGVQKNDDGTTTTLQTRDMSSAFVNSLVVAIPATVIPILIAAFAAYAFAWMRFKGRRIMFGMVIALLVVPLQVALIPIYSDYTRLQINGTYLAVWLAHTGFGLALAIYLLYNYISQLPRDLFESAFIDGATPFTVFTRLVLPLSVPALASFAIFQFLWVWNDYLVALIFLSGQGGTTEVLTQRLANIVGTRGQDWHLLTAGAFISMLLPLIVFFSLQRFFVRGLLAGSVKG